jgi:hypothetical protein
MIFQGQITLATAASKKTYPVPHAAAFYSLPILLFQADQIIFMEHAK